MKKLLCTIGLILIGSCTAQDASPEVDTYASKQERAEWLKQVIANRERIFAEANKRKQVTENRERIFAQANKKDRLYHIQFQGLNYYSKFSEAKRQEIYRYAVTLDDKSGGTLDWEEGNKMVAKKYGISVTEARNIALEGAMKLWPQPEPPEPDFWKVK